MLFISGGQTANFRKPQRGMLFRKLGITGLRKVLQFLEASKCRPSAGNSM